MTKTMLLSAAAAMAFAAAPAVAQTAKNVPSQLNGAKVASGVSNGLGWDARSMIIGQTSTANSTAGGDPIYFATAPVYQGVVTMIMEYDFGAFICTGSAISARHVVSAAHCVSDGFGTANPNRTRVYFSDSPDPDLVRFGAGFDPVGDADAVDVSAYFVNPLYTGEVIDQNDIVVLELAADIPDYAPIYDLYTTDSLRGEGFNVVGNGGRSDTGGSVGTNLGTGVMRQGDNIFDYALGDPVFEGFWDGFFGSADVTASYVSDFDNGLAAQSQSQRVANGLGLGPLGDMFFVDNGVGALEVGVAGGDSGGPQFIDGKVAAVTSYGLSFGTAFGDFIPGLQSSWGEMNGFVPIYIHEEFISSIIDPQAVIPEPATWGMMIAGFGLVGFAARRRRGTDMAKVSA